MSKRIMILAGVALTVALLGAAVVVPAFAQEPTPTPEAPLRCHGRGFGLWRSSWAVFDAAAEALGLTPEELFAELHAGKSLADIAKAQGVELKAVHDAMKAARVEARKQAIEQAVENGRMSQEQADWLLEGLELGFLPRRWGFGRIRPRMRRW
ncbi:MAG: hypothetical protein U9R11_00565 [Chloroflexota bacterium]|nr:hypothetical protein [Chloroflexota bacterium]